MSRSSTRLKLIFCRKNLLSAIAKNNYMWCRKNLLYLLWLIATKLVRLVSAANCSVEKICNPLQMTEFGLWCRKNLLSTSAWENILVLKKLAVCFSLEKYIGVEKPCNLPQGPHKTHPQTSLDTRRRSLG